MIPHWWQSQGHIFDCFHYIDPFIDLGPRNKHWEDLRHLKLEPEFTPMFPRNYNTDDDDDDDDDQNKLFVWSKLNFVVVEFNQSLIKNKKLHVSIHLSQDQ